MNGPSSIRRSRSQGGNVMIEFALGSILLVTMFTGSFQYAYSFYQYNTLENSVRAAAQFAQQAAYGSATTDPPSCYSTPIKNIIIYGDPNVSSGTPLLPGLGTGNIGITMTFASGAPSSVTVGINSYTLNAIMGSTTLTNKPQVTMPYIGRWSPAGGC
jgi:Flp pilus assembly protein TadG